MLLKYFHGIGARNDNSVNNFRNQICVAFESTDIFMNVIKYI